MAVTTIEELWRWFDANEREFRSADAPILANWLESAIHQVDTHLGVEVSDDGGVREVIITAGGDPSRLDLVRALIRAGQTRPGWTFRGLKPPQGFEFVLSINNVRIEAGQLWFDPLVSEQSPDELGIRIYVAGDVLGTQDITEALWLIVETGIGEEAAAKIRHLEAAHAAQKTNECLPIADLAQYLAWHFQKRESKEDVGAERR